MKILDTYRGFDSFLKWQLWVGLISSITWALVIPVVHKLQGLYWTTAYISIYHMTVSSTGLILPLFKGMPLRKASLIDILISVIYALSLFVYFFSINAFLVLEAVLTVAGGVFFNLRSIGWEAYTVEKYGLQTFRDFRYWLHVRYSLGNILGGILVALISVFCDTGETLKVFGVAMVIMLTAHGLNWHKHYLKMDNSSRA